MSLPRSRDTWVDVPTARVMEMAKSSVTKGAEIFTPASARAFTPRATKMASTSVYSMNTI